MQELETMKSWIEGFPGMATLCVDQISPRPHCGSIAPQGMVELSREVDLLGTVTVFNRWDLKLYFVLPKEQEENEGAAENAQWLMELQTWIQAQSAMGCAPVMGDIPSEERFVAQQGKLEENKGEGTAIYSVKLAVYFAKRIRPEVR